MSLIIDRDLLVIEPHVFVAGETVGTILGGGSDASISGTTLTSAGVDFEALGIDEGHVALVDGKALEVIARPGASSLTVSRPRAKEEDPTIPPDAGTGLKFTVPSFDRQIAAAQAWALGALGLDAHDPVQPLDETAVINAEELGTIIALRAICDIFATASAVSPADDSDAQFVQLYRERLRRTANATSVLLDLNGDGVADAARRLSTLALRRT